MDVREKLIDANELLNSIRDDYNINGENFARIRRHIEAATAVDAVEVVHGRWIDKGEYAVCTECGGRSGTQYDGVEPIPLMTQFCPNCGVKMDGGAD